MRELKTRYSAFVKSDWGTYSKSLFMMHMVAPLFVFAAVIVFSILGLFLRYSMPSITHPASYIGILMALGNYLNLISFVSTFEPLNEISPEHHVNYKAIRSSYLEWIDASVGLTKMLKLIVLIFWPYFMGLFLISIPASVIVVLTLYWKPESQIMSLSSPILYLGISCLLAPLWIFYHNIIVWRKG